MSGEFSTAPYPGLRPFRPEESDIYFGREAQTDALLEKLSRSRFLAVVGPSGCGKSSLVRAGMIAALETGFMAEAGVDWRIAEMRPGGNPMPRLADALQRSFLAAGVSDLPSCPLLEAALCRGPLGLAETVQAAGLPAGTNLLLLVDQFEEIFRYRQKGDSDEADAFVALLLASAAERELPLYVVITMRSDFLGDCALFNGLPEAINDCQYLTPRLTREQGGLAITGPARVFGGSVEPDLVNRLLNDFGPDPDQLPLLQHALMRMWDEASRRAATAGSPATIGQQDYDRIGGLAQALSNHADEVMDELAPEQRKIAEVLFRRLTERGIGQRDTRAPARLSNVAAVAGVGEAAVYPVVEAFRRADRSFVTPPVGIELGPDTLLDIGHESLIRQWKTLGEWVDRESRSAALYRRLALEAKLWRQGDAALWRNPNLQRALDWERDEQPAPAWAARYGTAEEFEQALAFLRESERAWQEEKTREELAARREREQQVTLQTQAAAQEKLQAENAALRSHRRFLASLAVLLPVAALAAGWAGWQWKVARDQTHRATVLLHRLTSSDKLKRAFLTEDAAQIRDKAVAETELGQGSRRPEGIHSVEPAPPPAEPKPETPAQAAHSEAKGPNTSPATAANRPSDQSQIGFGARKDNIGWKSKDGTALYRYSVFPLPETLKGPLRSAIQVTYFMDHSSFPRKLIATGPSNKFTGYYEGWGCLTRVYALVEYDDPDRQPEAYWFNACEKLKLDPLSGY
jgi:hypothetical protein